MTNIENGAGVGGVEGHEEDDDEEEDDDDDEEEEDDETLEMGEERDTAAGGIMYQDVLQVCLA